MRFVLLLSLICACDFKPPKREVVAGSAAAAPAAPVDAVTAQLPPPPAVDAGAAVVAVVDAGAPMDLTKECTDVAVHIAEQVIRSVSDPNQKAELEQDRTKLVRRAAETCTRDKWSDAARACFLAANTKETLEACGKQLAPP
ncbi:MAG: hypothetical protein ABI867_22645 [Kofleriaceae bacterium]